MSGNEREGMLSLKGIMLSVLTILVLALSSQRAIAADPKQIYDQATNALYNLDFSTAERSYETLTHDYPENPDYWNALASAVWLKITFDQQKRNFPGLAVFVNPNYLNTVNRATLTGLGIASAQIDSTLSFINSFSSVTLRMPPSRRVVASIAKSIIVRLVCSSSFSNATADFTCSIGVRSSCETP